MNPCQIVRNFFALFVRIPVEWFFETAEEVCHEISTYVETQITREVERHRTTTERRCREEKCYYLCLCCNKLICWFVTVVMIVIELVVEVIGEWIIETVCQIVIKVVKIVVEGLITVVRFVVVAIVCLAVLDFAGALDALIEFWFDLVDLLADFGKLIVTVLNAVVRLLDILREFVFKIGNKFGPPGRFFIGILAGLIDIVRKVVEGVTQIVDGLFGVITAVARLDFCAALEALGQGVGFGLIRGVLGIVNIAGLGIGGAARAFSREQVRLEAEAILNARFGNNIPIMVETNLRLNSTSFGTTWPVIPRICSISSRSPNLDLRAMHNAGTIDLFAAAGYAPIGCARGPFDRTAMNLVYAGTQYRVAVGDIRAYLAGTDTSVAEFVLRASDKETLKQMLTVAKRNFQDMAIELQWGAVADFEINGLDEMVIPNNPTPLVARMTNELGLGDICDMPAAMVFDYTSGANGYAAVYWRGGTRQETGATVRNNFLTDLFGTVLAHEMGHAFSLCHAEHDGVHNIMFTNASGGNNCGVQDPTFMVQTGGDLDVVTGATVFEYIFAYGEPHFTLVDAKNSWVWILDEAGECVGIP